MGRRKIEIKAIKDDRNRSVTFLKRKGGLFKKAHELSVLCSVDVAVFIFGQNKKLYEYSSGDMRELITRYTYHGGPNEHKGPADFNGGADDDEDDEGDATPPHGERMGTPMMPQHFQGQPPFPHMRHHTPSASPPIPNGVAFAQHAAQGVQRVHTPQPQIGSRPGSRNDMRRMPPHMVPPQVGPHGPPQGPQVNGYAYIPQPAIYNPQNPNMPQPGHQYPYAPPPPHMQQYMENHHRQSSVPPNFPPQPQQAQPPPPPVRHSLSPPQQTHGLPAQAAPQPSPQPPHSEIRSPPPPPPPQTQPQSQEATPVPVHLKPEVSDRLMPQAPLLDTASAIKKMPQRKQHSIFTPIDENRSVLSQHLAAFAEQSGKADPNGNRSQSLDMPSSLRNTTSPPQAPKRAETGPAPPRRQVSVSSIPEADFTPPSRTNSFRTAGGARPRLKVQIPDEPSDAGSNTAESSSAGPGHSTDATSQTTRPGDSHSSGIVLPPPSPSATTTLLSAGATGPPNPFARPPNPNNQQNHMNIDTPASALPSRYMNNEFLPSPSSFFPDMYARGHDSNTLPSPLNFATPVVGSGPSFLREELSNTGKRKSPEMSSNGPPSDPIEPSNEPKRLKVGN
ncbi:MADS-box MEF2 type transcription factor [Diaporthe sp. PMI_573]|nr:MADS-box MEF2 type transcription factor [Diaporthaceae sp. PMI_573]